MMEYHAGDHWREKKKRRHDPDAETLGELIHANNEHIGAVD
jgi:hypothetical protein